MHVQMLRGRLAAGAALAGLAASLMTTPAAATIFYSNYTPSDTAATGAGAFLPLEYRTPDASQSFGPAASNSTYCTNAFCNPFYGDQVITSFTVNSTFDASNLIVPIAVYGNVGNRRSGFNIEHLVGAAWEGLGFMQVESGLLPQGPIREVDVQFGDSNGVFGPVPIHFVAGDTYRIRTNLAAGGVGTLLWYLSDTAAAPGQSHQYSNYPGVAGDLGYQPAFALTDGGDLTPPAVSGVPEPAAWGLMLLGFFGLGGVLRTRRRPALA